MSHLAVRKPGILCYSCDGHHHFVKVASLVCNEGVFIAEVSHTSSDGSEWVEAKAPYDILRPIAHIIFYESEEAGW